MRGKQRKLFLAWLVGSLVLTLIFTVVIDIYLENNTAYRLGWETFMALVVGVLAAVISYFTFAQRQEIEEIRLFRELFDNFNDRYDEMNEALNQIVKLDHGEEPNNSLHVKQILFDYFNLCAEEYFYYKRGCIYQEVWRSWCCGMDYYLSNEYIKDLWDTEQETQGDSYYGLTYSIIQGTIKANS